MRSGRRIFIKGVSSAAIGAGIVSGCPTPTKKETSKESSHSEPPVRSTKYLKSTWYRSEKRSINFMSKDQTI